ncbi:hypothetical protein [Catenovulum sediminis]|uniref:hypothetical protein n=1 Tax=Catenovulum sediminis TaxID=1740262 RepID=UPI0011802EB3|nr:hypothetical protein [Catenovulum sediminis]
MSDLDLIVEKKLKKLNKLNSNCGLNDIVIIVYYGRSGSYFLHSLLDSHPDLICLPPIINSFQFELSKCPTDITTVESGFSFVEKKFGPFFGASYKAEQENYFRQCETGNLDVDNICEYHKFKKYFFYYFNLLTSEGYTDKLRLFLTINYSFDSCLNGEQSIERLKQKKIVFQLHNPLYDQINWYAKNFNKCTVLQMVRSPLVALRSLLRCKMESNNLTPDNLVKILGQLFFNATQHPNHAVKHIGIKLEDLHASPNAILSRLCNRLAIQWDDCLLRSSFGGRRWSNVKGREHISGFSPSSQAKICLSDLIPVLDEKILLKLFAARYRSWGYQLPSELEEDPLQVLKTHTLLIEYLPYFSSIELARKAYEKQLLITRSEKVLFFYRYVLSFNEPFIEVIECKR